MFSGIVEGTGHVKEILKDGTNIHFTIEAPFTHELKIDQSIAHDGACLTVVRIEDNSYVVTAIQETLNKTTLSSWQKETPVNLERCMKIGDRLDGHIVQGHVDTTAACISRQDIGGSWKFGFRYEKNPGHITVSKGSICINGVSLTVVDSDDSYFSVCIIPYTMEHTNFKHLVEGMSVNLEFDVIGKYVARLLASRS